MKKFFISCLSGMLIMGSFLWGEELTVRKMTEKTPLPESICTEFEEGDFLVSDGKFLTLIGGSSRTLQSILNYPAADAMGAIIGFVPAGKDLLGNVIAGTPHIWIGGKKQEVKYTSVRPVSRENGNAPLVMEATAPFQGENGEKAHITTRYLFVPRSGKIELESSIKNTGRDPIKNLFYSVYFNASHTYSFSPYHKEFQPELNFRIYPKKGHFLGLVDQNPPPADNSSAPGTLDPGESYGVRFLILTDDDGAKLLEDVYLSLNTAVEKASIYFETQDRDLTEVIVRDVLRHSVYYRNFLDNPYALEIPLPPGLYTVTANFFPGVDETLLPVETGSENRCFLRDPPHGEVLVKIQDALGRHVPGKVTFIGLDPTKSPYFKPENPVETGKRWETFKNSCFPEEAGLNVRLPVGNYLAYASRGPEYTMETKIVEIFQNDTMELVFRINKVINTEHLISVDPHMHTIYSDGTVNIAERIKSVVAEGVDVAVATDHNYINDYLPTLHKLGLNPFLATIVGNEVTTGGVIHFNTYPLLYREDEQNNGAINPHRKTATPMFQDSRDKDPQALLQVNHPRSGTIGYFNNFGLDPRSAATADKNLDLNFDVLEALNGPYPFSSNEQSINDWLNLMSRGYFFPIVASSDSHTIDGGQPGYSRTYVFYDGKKGEEVDVESVISGMKKGHSFATNGPLVDLKINGTHIPGDIFTAHDSKMDIRIKVESAPWVSVNEVRLIINGERKIIFPVDAKEDPVMKFSQTITLPVEKDCYIAAEVLGDKSLFPVHQARPRHGLRKNATLPYAVTNPIFIDADGNGEFDPPLPQTIYLLESSETETKDEPGK